jgi:hypothetical protein
LSVVLSIRIPRHLNEKMRKYKNINLSEEIRRYIEKRIAELEAEEVLRRHEEKLDSIAELPSGTLARWIRSDRDSH